MFVVEKVARGHRYLYLAESVREGGRVRQRRTRSAEAIPGHVFCSFLALLRQKELADLCATKVFRVEWGDLLHDLDRLQEATIEKDGKRITTRTHVKGQVGSVFQAVGVALPQNIENRPLERRPNPQNVVQTPVRAPATHSTNNAFRISLLK
ncbi:MAG: hypothetical protein EOQ31_35410 [Mesorhizobium sp.]|uniref:hypothetical protein n=1 Tax=Mesorhizobium sp. TaxID=1871066 RepID=UPI000FEAA6EE|nr:hypothetical protein [Mesorhizobium sp.]RWA78334.1 MAG: hypothetical protein EOQ31_35410 [Mesorhizobium sp.]